MTHDQIQQRIKELKDELKKLHQLDEENLKTELKLTAEKIMALGAHSIVIDFKPEYDEDYDAIFHYVCELKKEICQVIDKVFDEVKCKFPNRWLWFIWHEDAQ